MSKGKHKAIDFKIAIELTESDAKKIVEGQAAKIKDHLVQGNLLPLITIGRNIKTNQCIVVCPDFQKSNKDVKELLESVIKGL